MGFSRGQWLHSKFLGLGCLFFFSKPASGTSLGADFSLNVSKVDGGVHGHRAIVLLKPYISTVDRGPPRELPLNDAICLHT